MDIDQIIKRILEIEKEDPEDMTLEEDELYDMVWDAAGRGNNNKQAQDFLISQGYDWYPMPTDDEAVYTADWVSF
jgi:hypothetical protein